MKENLLKKLILPAIFILFFICMLQNLYAEQNVNTFDTNLVILAEEQDAYFPLAQEIADYEKAVLITSIEKLNDLSPKYLIYVAVPNNISMEALLKFSRFFKNSGKYPAFGIITGKTIESARKLWQRSKLATEGVNFIATDTDYAANFDEGIIFDVSTQPPKKITLNRENLLNALVKADYFYWSRHVSYRGWFWHYKKHDFLHSRELPELKPVVIHTPSCNSVLPSEDDNIALEFVEKGAAAYIGHLLTPTFNSGVFIGHLQHLPGKYTWKDFPIGIMAQIQNIASMKASSFLPYMFILGDPRTSLSKKKPYTIIQDQSLGNKRSIQGKSNMIGVLPLKIDDGASYSYIKIKGLSSVSNNDLFYNSKIQSLNLQSDKYLLFLHKGGTFEISLYKSPSLLWIFSDTIKDALDFSWITKGVTRSLISIFFFLIFLSIVLIKIKKKKPITGYSSELVFALAFASIQLIFVILRMHSISISSYFFNFPMFKLLLGFLGTFSMAASGMILIHDTKKIYMKTIGLCLCVLPQFLLTIFFFAILVVRNYYFQSTFNTLLWNWNPVIFPLIVLILELFIFSIFFVFKSKRPPAKRTPVPIMNLAREDGSWPMVQNDMFILIGFIVLVVGIVVQIAKRVRLYE